MLSENKNNMRILGRLKKSNEISRDEGSGEVVLRGEKGIMQLHSGSCE